MKIIETLKGKTIETSQVDDEICDECRKRFTGLAYETKGRWRGSSRNPIDYIDEGVYCPSCYESIVREYTENLKK